MGGNGGIKLEIPRNMSPFAVKLNALLQLDNVKLNKDIANAMRNSTLRRFKSETDPEGDSWEPSERAVSEGDKTLTDTGDLKNSITTAADAYEAEVGTNKVYARVHQLGGEDGQPNGTMPARPFLGLSKDDHELVLKIVEGHIKKALE